MHSYRSCIVSSQPRSNIALQSRRLEAARSDTRRSAAGGSARLERRDSAASKTVPERSPSASAPIRLKWSLGLVAEPMLYRGPIHPSRRCIVRSAAEGRFSTARSGAPSRLRHSGAHRQVPRHGRARGGQRSGSSRFPAISPVLPESGTTKAARRRSRGYERLRRAYRAAETKRYNFTFFPFHLAVVTAARSARASMPAITSS